jgi:hypothetical protein
MEIAGGACTPVVFRFPDIDHSEDKDLCYKK